MTASNNLTAATNLLIYSSYCRMGCMIPTHTAGRTNTMLSTADHDDPLLIALQHVAQPTASMSCTDWTKMAGNTKQQSCANVHLQAAQNKLQHLSMAFQNSQDWGLQHKQQLSRYTLRKATSGIILAAAHMHMACPGARCCCHGTHDGWQGCMTTATGLHSDLQCDCLNEQQDD